MTRRALIVDDELEMCQLIQSVLISTGMNSLSLTKSAEASRYLENEKFDVLLLDLRMPNPDGIEVAHQARGSGFNRSTPIIMMSDDQQLSAVSEGFKAGVSFFLYKPIDKGRLVKLIQATQGAIEHERRRFRRVEYRSKVHLTSDEGDMDAETVDISLNGMMVRAPHTIPPGSSVHVSLDLSPGMKPVVGTGSVMRVIGTYEMGIQLDRMSFVETSRLQEFLLPLIIPG
jgi:DNA-binding response OmpR family regulator